MLMFTMLCLLGCSLKFPDIINYIIFIPLKVLSLPVQGFDWILCNYVDSYIIAFNSKIQHVLLKTGIGELFNGYFAPRVANNLEDVIIDMNNNMSGIKTGISTASNGEGINRTSVIDYVNEFFEHPDDIVDKGIDPGVSPLPNIIQKPAIEIANPELEDAVSEHSSVWEDSHPAPVPSTSNLNPVPQARAYSRSGATTPNHPDAIGLASVLVTDTHSPELVDKLNTLQSPSHPIPSFVENAGSSPNPYLNQTDPGLVDQNSRT